MRSYRIIRSGCPRAQICAPIQTYQSAAVIISASCRAEPITGHSRGFRTSSRYQFKKEPANDDPEDHFEHTFSKRRVDVSATNQAYPHTKTQPQSPTAPTAAPFSEEANTLAEGFGFLFDCDGVLYAGNRKIESAKAALKLCRQQQTRYLYLTNGGGNTTEAQKATSLLKKIGIQDNDLVEGRVIQSHTPLRTFKESTKRDETIYITSLDPARAREIAYSYGFKKVVTAADILHQYDHIFPFKPKNIMKEEAIPFPDDAKIWSGDPSHFDETELLSGNHLKIDHIFVFNDPRDWSLETQIIHDILTSHKGYLGTISPKNGNHKLENDGWQQDGQPKVWVSNLDLLWKTEHPINRFGTGAFVHAFRGVWKESTGHELQYKYMGKPSQITYEFAHDALLRDVPSIQNDQVHKPLRRVYMVGDNPESDIRGALEFNPQDGTEYVPILVKTGVWQETEAEKQPRWQPAVIVDDVLDAVTWAMRQEGINIERKDCN